MDIGSEVRAVCSTPPGAFRRLCLVALALALAIAAGFLAARCRGRELKACLETGAMAAAEIISHFGARPETDLRELVAL